MMQRTDVPLRSVEPAAGAEVDGMAAEVKHQHVLKCFQWSNLMALLTRLTEAVLGKARVAELRPAMQECSPPHRMYEVEPAARPGIPIEFACTLTVGRM